MDNIPYYDSLDEEFSSASSSSIIVINSTVEGDVLKNEVESNLSQKASFISVDSKRSCSSSLNLNKKQCKPEQPLGDVDNTSINYDPDSETGFHFEQYDIRSIVPLYTGDTSKYKIRQPGIGSATLLLDNTRNSYATAFHSTPLMKRNDNTNNNIRRRSKLSCSNTLRTRSKVEVIVQEDSRRSYLSMFHARIGYPTETSPKPIQDTQRAIFGDSHISMLTQHENGDNDTFTEEADNSDSISFYCNHIEEERKKCEVAKCVITSTSIGDLPQAKFNSISEYNIPSNFRRNTNTKKKLRSKITKLTPVPTLGGLGPDTATQHDKVELRKKQLIYGQTASYRNRIKMVEMSVLKNLKEEIQDSNVVDEEHACLKSV